MRTACEWPTAASRELFIKYLELESRLAGKAAKGETDLELLRELDDLLRMRLPKTAGFIERCFLGDLKWTAADIEKIAWAESRATEDESGTARVEGVWTTEEIDRDIEECRRSAKERSA
jgi:hypothetical protein